MASVTTFYPTRNTAPYSPTTWRGGWQNSPSHTRTLSDDKTGAPIGALSASRSALMVGNPFRLGIVRWISNPLEAQTISGTLDFILQLNQSNALGAFYTKIYAYVLAGDTDTVRGVLLDYEDSAAAGGAWTVTVPTGKALPAPEALTPVAASANDRLVVEFGAIAVGGDTSNRIASVTQGITNRFSSGAILVDLAVSGTGNSAGGFLLFSNAITVKRPNTADGDLLVGNQQLYLYDGTTGALKRRVLAVGSEDPAGGVQLFDDSLRISYESLNSGDDPENGQIAEYDESTLAYVGVTQAFPAVGPHALAPNLLNQMYLGAIGDGITESSCGSASDGGPSTPVTAASAYIRKFSAAGALLDTYAAAVEASGTNAIDLAADQATMFYTSLGRLIKRYDVVADVQLSDYATLPAATAGEMARGLRILPDGSVLVVDTINVKRLVAGVVTTTYSIIGQTDWGTIALSPDGESFWVANRADSSVCPPMIAKFAVTGSLILTISGASVPNTNGGMCSGGITVINGFRAALNAEPPPIDETIYPPNDIEPEPVVRVRCSPHVNQERKRVTFYSFQLDAEAGVGTNTGQGSDPLVEFQISRDGARTWGPIRLGGVGKKGDYIRRTIWRQLGQSRDTVFRLTQSDPVKTAWIAAYVEAEEDES